jgi:hypothetical protein
MRILREGSGAIYTYIYIYIYMEREREGLVLLTAHCSLLTAHCSLLVKSASILPGRRFVGMPTKFADEIFADEIFTDEIHRRNSPTKSAAARFKIRAALGNFDSRRVPFPR